MILQEQKRHNYQIEGLDYSPEAFVAIGSELGLNTITYPNGDIAFYLDRSGYNHDLLFESFSFNVNDFYFIDPTYRVTPKELLMYFIMSKCVEEGYMAANNQIKNKLGIY